MVDATNLQPNHRSPTPEQLASVPPFVPDPNVTPQASFLLWPCALSDWGNDNLGDCESAEEGFAKAAAPANPVNLPASAVVAWAIRNGYVGGANAKHVLDSMRYQGFQHDGLTYNDGPYFSVNLGGLDLATADELIASAIYECGPMKLGVGDSGFGQSKKDPNQNVKGCVTNNKSGWTMYDYPEGNDLNHEISVCGYGDLQDLISLFSKHGVTVTPVENMPTGRCYAMFTWNSIGIVDAQSLMNMATSANSDIYAFVRKPVTEKPTPTNVFVVDPWTIWSYEPKNPSNVKRVFYSQDGKFGGVAAFDNTFFLNSYDGIWKLQLAEDSSLSQIASTKGVYLNGGMAKSWQGGKTYLYLTGDTNTRTGIYYLEFSSSITSSNPKLSQISSTVGFGFNNVIAVPQKQENGKWVYTALFLATPNDGLYTLNTAFVTSNPNDPPVPIQIQSTKSLRNISSLVVVPTENPNNHGWQFLLYVITLDDGIYTFDPNNPTSAPIQLASTKNMGFPHAHAIGNTLYLTQYGPVEGIGISTFDVTAPDTPPQPIAGAGPKNGIFTGITSI